MDKIFKGSLLILLFILPLSTFDNLFLRSLIVPVEIFWVMSALVGALFLLSKKSAPFRLNNFTLLIFAYFACEIIRDAVAGPPLKALFGDVRGAMLSISMSFSLVVLYFTCQQVSDDEKFRRRIIATMGLSLSLVALIALAQYLGILGGLMQSGRARATLYNPVELAGVSILMLVAITGLFSTETRPNHKIISGIMIVLLSIAIITSGSKIAIFLSALYFAGYIVKTIIRQKQQKLILSVASILLLAMVFFGLKTATRGAGEITNNDLAQNSEVSASISGRIPIWRNALYMSFERPVIGWGQADFPNMVTMFVSQSKIADKNALTTHDVHNFIFDALVKGGLIKLLIIAAIIFYMIKQLLLGKISDDISKKVIMSAAFYMLFLLFDPSYVVSRVYLVTLLGLMSLPENRGLNLRPEVFKYLKYGTVLILFAVFSLQLFLGINRLRAEAAATKALDYFGGKQSDKSIILSKQAIKIFPLEVDYYSRLGGAYLWKYRADSKKEALMNAQKYYLKGLRLSGKDVVIMNKIIKIQTKLKYPNTTIDL